MPTIDHKTAFKRAFGTETPTEENLEKLKQRCSASTYWFTRIVVGHTVWKRVRFDPDLHGEAARWVSRPTLRKCGLMPRDHLKTSLWTIGHNLRLATNDPEQRILLINEIVDNAAAWIGSMQTVVLESPFYRAFYPQVIPDPREVTWNATSFCLKRKHATPEPTFTAIGVGGATTSRHFTRVHEDDLVGKKAAKSQLVMQEAIDQHKLAESLLQDPEEDEICTIGTRWGVRDLAHWMLENEVDLDYFCLSCWHRNGEPIWPARFSTRYLNNLRLKYGPAFFALQYENRAIASGLTEFPLDWLRTYTFSEYKGETVVCLHRPAHEGGTKYFYLNELEIFELIDPGYSPDSKDARTAVVVVGITPEEPYSVVLLDVYAKAVSINQVQDVAWEKWQQWQPLLAGIEIVGAQRQIYYDICTRYPNMMLTMLKTDTRTSKLARIRRLGPLGEQGRLYYRRDQADFVEEWETFPNGTTVDTLDALAYGFQIWAPPERSRDEDEEFDEDDRAVQGMGGRSARTGY